VRAAFGAAVLAALLCGCGQLTVKVDVLEPEYVHGAMAEERLRALYRDIAAASPGEMAARVDRQLRDYQREVGELARLYEAAGRKLGTGGEGFVAAAEGLRSAVQGPTLLAEARRQGDKAEALAQQIREAAAESRWSGRERVPAGLREQLLAFEAAQKSEQVKQRAELRAATGSADALRAVLQAAAKPPSTGSAPAAASPIAAAAPEIKAIDRQAAVLAATQRSIIGDGSLAATEFAHVVAQAPDHLWAPNFNRAFARGTFGNVDVVIRLNSTADFSVKGMLFDATKVAQVASKVMTQTVLVATQIAGVSAPAASTDTASGGAALSKASADLAAAEASLARRQAQLSGQREAVRSLARTVLGAAPALESEAFKGKTDKDPARVPLHKSIDDTLGALKPLLQLADLQ
jgi:hypothetical protein